MSNLVHTKALIVTSPAAIIDNASATTNEIDTAGWDFLEIYFIIGATDIAMTALTATESDTSASGHAAITGLVWGTSANDAGSTSTLPSASNDDTIFKMEIDLRARKRYIDVTATIGDGTAGTYFTALAILSRADESPTTASGKGCVEILAL